MNHAATTKASKFVFPERHLPLWLLPISLPTQHGIDSTQLLNVPCVLLDDNLCLTESRRLKILLVLDNLVGHLLRQNSVVLVQHAKRLLMLVFWCAHKFLTTHITGGGASDIPSENNAESRRPVQEPCSAPLHFSS